MTPATTLPPTKQDLHRAFKGVAGCPRADVEEQAMRAVQRREHDRHREDRILASDTRRREQVDRGAFGHQALRSLGALIGADTETQAARAGAGRAAKRSRGESRPWRWVPGPSSNWTES